MCFSCSTAGNASYVIGTLAETDLGKKRIVHICTDKGDQAKKILPALTGMLDMVDTETVMNAAGTMGTLVRANNNCLILNFSQICQNLFGSSTELISEGKLVTEKRFNCWRFER